MSETIHDLTEQQLRFCQNIAAGFPKGKSYTSAGYRAEGKSANTCASRLLHRPEIQRAITWLRNEQRAVFLLSWEQKIKTVERLINDPETKPHTRLAAIRLHNQMMADYEPFELAPPAEPAEGEYGHEPKPEPDPVAPPDAQEDEPSQSQPSQSQHSTTSKETSPAIPEPARKPRPRGHKPTDTAESPDSQQNTTSHRPTREPSPASSTT